MNGKSLLVGFVGGMLLAMAGGAALFLGGRAAEDRPSEGGIADRADRIRANFERRRAGQEAAPAPAGFERPSARATGPVRINGRELDRAQLDEFRLAYGAEPAAGDWWYDPLSGLYGPAGRPATGFMLPGHTFGDLRADASGGRSGVYVNGRELPAEEVTSLAFLLGMPVQRGRYWFDALGNWGVEGTPFALGNLYATFQARLAASANPGAGLGGPGALGGAGGADNFWTSRFSAGNSNAQNTQGYVSVPGYGPVGYGF